VENVAVCIVSAVDFEGHRDVLGHWLGDRAEGANCWLMGRTGVIPGRPRPLAHTLCHRAAWRSNLFARHDQDGREQTVAINWSDVGIGALGEEMAAFVLSPAAFYKLKVADLPYLDRIAFADSLTGLRAAGWSGSAQLVRLYMLPMTNWMRSR
jgi:hypothetical protein